MTRWKACVWWMKQEAIRDRSEKEAGTQLIKAVEWSCYSVEPQHFPRAKRSLWKKPGTLHECSPAVETCQCRNFVHLRPSAACHSSSRVLHGRLAGRVLLRCEKDFETSGSLPCQRP
ncbi:hypothetical protein HBI56_166320 [Parastagonospora nodorum]|nr:hypothetical protein HBH52_068680 [Parastagonospora nodorum]KAH4024495.1 hypothetical protein HBI09_161550 [Parastagonospora nodorum]KAH4210223.1 hypothetical protein HBI95_072680 [Parastagonospora nodorum]KAH4227955.1 hypothetical protein HBI06_097420 [Parastagonospora nodorum]KAH4233003.1 hypothetical protein HBI05_166920 [Parastagonospora nodorum]